MHDIHFLQTADPVGYAPMLEVTSRTVIEFCRRHGHSYESYVGIRRGAYPWHAAFNRIPMLHDLLKLGFRGWAIYLDSDAFIVDLDFDLAGYLADKADRAGVMVHMGAGPTWAINSGVLFFNFGNPIGRTIVERWHEKFARLSDADLAGLSEWRDEMSDQSMLFEVLDEHVAARDAVHYDSDDLLNRHSSRFIRQHLRAYYPDLASRIAALRATTTEILGVAKTELEQDVYPAAVQALYRVVLGRDPDAEGLAGFTRHFGRVGLEAGLRDALSNMLDSPEYRARRER